MRNALITGGTGFIGSHLAERLRDLDWKVSALVRDPDKLKFLDGSGVRILPGDLQNLPELPGDIDVVFHLAGLTKALQTAFYYKINQEGTASFLDALVKLKPGPRVVLLSTFAAAGPGDAARPRREDDPPAPVSPYGDSKLQGEREALARKHLLQTAIVRVGAVYGPRDADFLDYFKTIKRGLLPSFGRKRRLMTVCYVRDLVDGLLAVAGSSGPSGEIYNIGHPEPCAMDDIGRAAARALGVRARRLVLPLSLVYAVAYFREKRSAGKKAPTAVHRAKVTEYRQSGWVADVGKARERLGFTAATPLEEGIRETIDWYKSAGRL
jgi:nucleoside-diphosphate-sugar epimerase